MVSLTELIPRISRFSPTPTGEIPPTIDEASQDMCPPLEGEPSPGVPRSGLLLHYPVWKPNIWLLQTLQEKLDGYALLCQRLALSRIIPQKSKSTTKAPSNSRITLDFTRGQSILTFATISSERPSLLAKHQFPTAHQPTTSLISLLNLFRVPLMKKQCQNSA